MVNIHHYNVLLNFSKTVNEIQLLMLNYFDWVLRSPISYLLT